MQIDFFLKWNKIRRNYVRTKIDQIAILRLRVKMDFKKKLKEKAVTHRLISVAGFLMFIMNNESISYYIIIIIIKL